VPPAFTKGLDLESGDQLAVISMEKEETRKAPPGNVGLCASCRFMRHIESDRGSIFYLCERFATDASFPKYPRLPVLRCAGYESLKS